MDDEEKEKKKQKDRTEYYKGIAAMSDLSFRIAITGIAIAGALYYIATSCVPQGHSGLERKIKSPHSQQSASAYAQLFSNEHDGLYSIQQKPDYNGHFS